MEEARESMRAPLLAESGEAASVGEERGESVESEGAPSHAAPPPGALASPAREDEMLRMAVWEGALLSGYLWTRGWVMFAGLPSDGVRTWNAADVSGARAARAAGSRPLGRIPRTPPSPVRAGSC